MKTMISKKTGIQVFGNVVQSAKQGVREDGELITYWLFETEDSSVWECHSDYWELIDADLRKTTKCLRINESQESNLLYKLKNILKWGFCKNEIS